MEKMTFELRSERWKEKHGNDERVFQDKELAGAKAFKWQRAYYVSIFYIFPGKHTLKTNYISSKNQKIQTVHGFKTAV